jgi:hypothetical protein
VKKALPEEYLNTPLSKISGMPETVIKIFGPQVTVGTALDLDLAQFARRTGLDIGEVTQIRRRLLKLEIVETGGQQ